VVGVSDIANAIRLLGYSIIIASVIPTLVLLMIYVTEKGAV
jgi:hypothetical protein